MQDPATPELPPGFLAVVFIPSSDDGEENLITTQLAHDCPEVLGGILRGIKAAVQQAV